MQGEKGRENRCSREKSDFSRVKKARDKQMKFVFMETIEKLQSKLFNKFNLKIKIHCDYIFKVKTF